jgi:prepilin-type N-terminal cleavage/methylation domain-containing protein
MDMKDKQKGMTLIELVIGLGLMSMVLAVLYAIFFTGLKSFDRQIENANNQTTARQTLSYIGREIRRAENIKVYDDKKGLVVDYGGSEIEYEFNHSNNILYRVKNGTKNPMIEGIKDFNIEELDDTYYFLNITVISERHNNPITITTQIRMRE